MKTNTVDNSTLQSTPATVAATTSGVRLGGLKPASFKVHKDFHAPMTDDHLIPVGSDDAPALTQADFECATYRVAGKNITKAEWQAVVRLQLSAAKIK